MLLHKKIQKAATCGHEESRSEAPDERDTGAWGGGSRTGYTPVVPDRPFFFFSFTLFSIPSSWPCELCCSLVQTSGLRKRFFFPTSFICNQVFPTSLCCHTAGLSGLLCNSKMGTVQEGFFGLRFYLLVFVVTSVLYLTYFHTYSFMGYRAQSRVQIHLK